MVVQKKKLAKACLKRQLSTAASVISMHVRKLSCGNVVVAKQNLAESVLARQLACRNIVFIFHKCIFVI
jgi:hypothetical protein